MARAWLGISVLASSHGMNEQPAVYLRGGESTASADLRRVARP